MWAYRSKKLLKEIAAVAPDVLCLQELDHYKDLSSELSRVRCKQCNDCAHSAMYYLARLRIATQASHEGLLADWRRE